MTHPDSPHAGRAHLDALQQQLVCDSLLPVRRKLKAVVQDRFLHVLAHPVRVRVSRSGQLIDQTLGPIRPEVPPDFVELLPAITDELTRLAYVPEILCEL